MTSLTPYDTGDRCEARPWVPSGTKVSEAIPADSFGKVDFDNDEGSTVCVVHVERRKDGRHIVHIQPLCDDTELDVVVDVDRANAQGTNVDATTSRGDRP